MSLKKRRIQEYVRRYVWYVGEHVWWNGDDRSSLPSVCYPAAGFWTNGRRVKHKHPRLHEWMDECTSCHPIDHNKLMGAVRNRSESPSRRFPTCTLARLIVDEWYGEILGFLPACGLSERGQDKKLLSVTLSGLNLCCVRLCMRVMYPVGAWVFCTALHPPPYLPTRLVARKNPN
jgi:hypothetical protein